MERRDLPAALLAVAAGAAVSRPGAALAQSAGVSGALIGPPLILTGTGTYTPSAGATAIYVLLIGGGGGSGGAEFASHGSASGGSGAGGICMRYITPLAERYGFFCGAGGAGGAAGAHDGSPGGVTRFSGEGIATLAAAGGAYSPGTRGGTVVGRVEADGNADSSNGDVNLPQRSGTPGFSLIGHFVAGSGGSNPYGVGPPGALSRALSGKGFGAGASGAAAAARSTPGAAGTDGAVLVWEYR